MRVGRGEAMKILFVWSSAEFSTWDVARGYRVALEKQGHVIHDYRLYARMKYHAAALGEEKAANLDLLTRMASDNVVVEALRHRADWVFIVSAMALHPDAVWLLKQIGVRTAVLFTESPYNDTEQHAFHAVYPEMRCFTNERTSVGNGTGWRYLPHAYDPEVHRPREQQEHYYDVLLLGTLWTERIQLLEQVDWTGIRLKLMGTWVAPPLPEESPIGKFYEGGCVPNVEAPSYYGAARICLNPFRACDGAESLNPRTYELAACRAFQLTDYRKELDDVFGVEGVATFTPESLEDRIRYWLAHPRERNEHREHAYRAVQPHTFDARAQSLLEQLEV